MNWVSLYLLTLIPELRDTAQGLGAAIGVVSAALVIPYAFTHDRADWEGPASDTLKGFWNFSEKFWKRGFLMALPICIVLGTVLPTQKNMMFIVGGSALLDIAQSDRAKGIADTSIGIVERWLKEQSAQ